jgi:hypothetical protein
LNPQEKIVQKVGRCDPERGERDLTEEEKRPVGDEKES